MGLVMVKKLPGPNHLFQTAQSGSLNVYAKIEETIAPAVNSHGQAHFHP